MTLIGLDLCWIVQNFHVTYLPFVYFHCLLSHAFHWMVLIIRFLPILYITFRFNFLIIFLKRKVMYNPPKAEYNMYKNFWRR